MRNQSETQVNPEQQETIQALNEAKPALLKYIGECNDAEALSAELGLFVVFLDAISGGKEQGK